VITPPKDPGHGTKKAARSPGWGQKISFKKENYFSFIMLRGMALHYKKTMVAPLIPVLCRAFQ